MSLLLSDDDDIKTPVLMTALLHDCDSHPPASAQAYYLLVSILDMQTPMQASEAPTNT
jgi:hypothetical protein